MNTDFTFSDTVAGYVVDLDTKDQSFSLRTSDGRLQRVKLTGNTFSRISYNLDEGYQDATSIAASLPDTPQAAYGRLFSWIVCDHTLNSSNRD